MHVKKSFLSLSVLCLSLVLNSCSNDDNKDTTKPVITLNEPKNEDEFSAGDIIHIDFDLADNSGIKSYKVDIHWGEGHNHGDQDHNARLSDSTLEEYSYQFVSEDQKGSKNVHVQLDADVIPSNVQPGSYHFGIMATDINGNEAQKYIEIDIK